MRRRARTGRDEQPTQGAALSVKRLTAGYGATVAIRDVSFDVMPGEIVTILGANGAGKTTSLNTIMGLVGLTGGAIFFEGDDITHLPTEAIVARGIALSPEGRRVFGKLTVEENLRIGVGLKAQSSFDERYAQVVDLFPVLDRKRGDFAGYLSGGEQQQLAIARALMSAPRLLLLDEPSLGLAPIVVNAVFDLIVSLRERGVTILLVEQNANRALEIADRAYVLSTGRVQVAGDADELRANTAVEDAYLGVGAVV